MQKHNPFSFFHKLSLRTQNWFLDKTSELVVCSLFLVIFSILAPFIFTRELFSSVFSETGQIGDTIGGLMNPFVAMAGVFTTFLAFLMQYKANEQQRTQFFQSIRKGEIDEKVDCYNKLALLKSDLDCCLLDIQTRKREISEYLESLKKTPYNKIVFYEMTLNLYTRVQSIDRNKIYNAMLLYMDNEYEKTLYNQLYMFLDEIPSTFQRIYTAIDLQSKNLDQCRNKLFSLMREIDNNGILYLSKRMDTDKIIEPEYRLVENFLYNKKDFPKDKEHYYAKTRKAFKQFKANYENLGDLKDSNEELKHIMHLIDESLTCFQNFDVENFKLDQYVQTYMSLFGHTNRNNYVDPVKAIVEKLNQALVFKNIEDVRVYWEKKYLEQLS